MHMLSSASMPEMSARKGRIEMKKKIVALSMRDQIYDVLKDSILRNMYAPNSMLPIDQLAEEFGVSATPVREALVKLEADGLIQLIPNKGAIVTDIQVDDVLNNWEMRKLLEPYAAVRSATLIPREELAQIREEIQSLNTRPFDKELYIASDAHIHETFYKYLPNPFLKDVIRRVHQMSVRIRYLPENSAAIHEKAVREVLSEHAAILDAFETGTPGQIEAAVRKHLENGEKRAMAVLHH